MHVTEFDYLKWPSIVDVQLLLNHLTNGIQVHLHHIASWSSVICQCKFYNIIFFNAYTYHLKLTQKNRRNAGVSHFLHLYWKKVWWPPILFQDFQTKSSSFQWEKFLIKKPLFIFMAILLNGTDWAITNQIASPSN